MTEEQKIAVHEIAAHYGIKSQEQVAIEECAELIQAITKSNRRVQNAKEFVERLGDIAGEIADVLIMCEQLAYLYGIEEIVKEQIEFKITRQMNRMRKGE